MIDGPETRRINVTAYSWNAFIFAGYGDGDQKPTLEQLAPGKSLVAHMEEGGDALSLDLDIHTKSADTAKSWSCNSPK